MLGEKCTINFSLKEQTFSLLKKYYKILEKSLSTIILHKRKKVNLIILIYIKFVGMIF